MSWPYTPKECPRCHYFDPVEPPVRDDAGYEVVGMCSNPRIAMDLFVLKQRDPSTMEPCPCFLPKGESDHDGSISAVLDDSSDRRS